MSEQNQSGKGDRSRVTDHKAYREGIDRIFGHSRTKKGYNVTESGAKKGQK